MGGDGVQNASLCRVGVRACSGEDGVVDACTLARELGKTIALTHCEFALLGVFVCGPGRALTRDMLLDATCHRRFEPFDRSVDVRVGRLRRKIEPDPKESRLIVTVPGEGYRFDGLATVMPANAGIQNTTTLADFRLLATLAGRNHRAAASHPAGYPLSRV